MLFKTYKLLQGRLDNPIKPMFENLSKILTENKTVILFPKNLILSDFCNFLLMFSKK